MNKLLFTSFAILGFNISYGQLSFQETQFINTSSIPKDIVYGDFNGDQLTDFAYTAETESILYVAYNLSNFNFSQLNKLVLSENEIRPTNSTPTFPIGVGDFNKDGFDDLACFDKTTGTLLLFYSNGSSFLQPVNISTKETLEEASDIEIADFNDDGNLDIIVAHVLSGNFDLYTGGSDNTFKYKLLSSTASSSNKIVIKDFNGDGKKDIVSVSYLSPYKLFVFIGDGQSNISPSSDFTFPSPITNFIVNDLNSDGLEDIICVPIGAGNKLFFIQSQSTTSSHTVSEIGIKENPLKAITSFDYDDDGRNDVIVASGASFEILKNTSGSFISTLIPLRSTGGCIDISFADFNNDNIEELTILGLGKSIEIFLKNGLNEFIRQSTIPLGITPVSILTTDLDSDGIKDIVSGSSINGFIAIAKGKTGQQFEDFEYYEIGRNPETLKDGDFNNDGKLDILYSTNNGISGENEIGLLLSSLSPKYSRKIIATERISDFEVSDFNYDGNLDFVTKNAMYIGDGQSNFTTSTFSAISYGSSVEIGSINGDSYLDVIVSTGDEIEVFIGNANGSLLSYAKINPENDSPWVSIGKLNNDELDDFVTVSQTENFNVFLNNGDGTFTSQLFKISGTSLKTISIADFDLDGYNDLEIPVYDGFEIYKGSGSGTFSPSGRIKIPDGSFNIVQSDINGDSKPDLIGVQPLFLRSISITINDTVAEPTEAASDLVFTNRTDSSFVMNLKKGNGSERLVVIGEAKLPSTVPMDGVFYAHNAKFKLGAKFEENVYAVYRGSGNSITVTNLKPAKKYYVHVFEYDLNSKKSLINYLTSSFASGEVTTKGIQTIIVNTISDQQVGGSIQPNAIATSGLSVRTEIVSGKATLTNGVINLIEAGPLTIKFTQNGNDDFMAAPIVRVTFCIKPKIPTVVVETISLGKILLTSSSDTNNQWQLYGNSIPGATNKGFSPVENGVYSVKVDYQGCSATSLPTSDLITGIEGFVNKLTVFPNPVNDLLSINWPYNNPYVERIFLLDGLGKKASLNFVQANELLIADLSEVSEGIYHVIIQTEKGNYPQRVVKNLNLTNP